jgi:hypothetical protein
MADNWLKDYRFTALELPRRDVAPADVLFRNNGAFNQKVGNLSMLFSSDSGLPTTTSGEPAGSISRTHTNKVEANLGFKILGALFGGGADSKLGADLKGKRARSFSVTYEDVTQDSLPVLELQFWLEQAKIRGAKQAGEWLEKEKLAAVTAVLRTAKLSIVAEGENGASIELNIPEIKGLVGGDAVVSADSTDSSKVTFEGKEPIAFGFQAFVMEFDKGVWLGLEPTRTRKAQDYSARAWTSETSLDELEDGSLPTD